MWLYIFIISGAGVFYTYIGYPLFLIFAAKFFKRPVNKKYITPDVTIFMVVYNEDLVVRAKIKNCLNLNYPEDKLTIVFASDGSIDKTNEIISEYVKEGIIHYDYEIRSGKMAVINKTMPKLKGEIIVFSDARELFNKNAIKELVANFNDESIGAVSGELILTERKKAVAGKSIRLYWEYEKRLRKREGEILSCVGATGAIYAIRRELFKPLPDDTILDDVGIPFKIIEQGYRVIFDREAKAYDDVAGSSGEEYKRKSRTLAGNWQILFRLRSFYHLHSFYIKFTFLSHKVSRIFLPVFFIFILISSGLIDHIFFKLIFILNIIFYVLAFSGLVLEKFGIKNIIVFHVPSVVFTLHFAIIAGLWKYLTDRQGGKWEKAKNLQ